MPGRTYMMTIVLSDDCVYSHSLFLPKKFMSKRTHVQRSLFRGVEKRVFGPPGSGKTTRLAQLVTVALKHYAPDQIVIASFTRAAARRLLQCDLPVPKERIGTLHALCYRAMGCPELAATHMDEWAEEYPWLAFETTRSLDDPDIPASVLGDSPGLPAFRKLQVVRAKMQKPDIDSQEGVLQVCWEEWKDQNDYVDFTDLIEHALADVEMFDNLYVGFFDEAQDFTPLELALVREMGKNMDYIVLAGDDDQNIYSFKGASPDSFLDPPIADEHKEILSRSFRLPAKVKNFTTRWIKCLSRREPKEFTPRMKDGLPVEGEVRYLYPANPAAIRMDVEQYLTENKSVMFLASCSYMLRSYQKALREAGIAYYNPYRPLRGDWNPLRSTAKLLVALCDVPADKMWSQGGFAIWAKQLGAGKDKVIRRGMKVKLAKLTDDGQGECEMTMEKIMEYFNEAAIPAFDTAWSAGPVELAEWYRAHTTKRTHQALEYPLAILRRRGTKGLKRAEIIMGTIHSVKGGEADVVYVLSDLSRQGHQSMYSQQGRDAVIRQFYVGMTRASETLVVCAATCSYSVPLGVGRVN